MSDDGFTDISQFLDDLTPPSAPPDLPGMGEPVTMAVTFLRHLFQCAVCGMRFTPTDGQLITATAEGVTGACCEACAVQILIP